MGDSKILTVGDLRRILAQYADSVPVYVVHHDTTGDPYLDKTGLYILQSRAASETS